MTPAGESPFHAFRWREEESVQGGSRVLRPTLDIRASSSDLEIVTKALVDTGAPRTVLPRGVGDALGFEFPYPSQADTTILLLGHRWPAITRTITLTLPPFEDHGWEALVDITLDDELPFGILGYEGFLNRWAVSFNAYHGYFIVEPIESFHERLPPDPFEQLQENFPDDYRPR